MKAPKNPATSWEAPLAGRLSSTQTPAANITAKFHSVTLPPPSLSDIHPPSGRMSAPARGPTHAHFSAPESGNSTDRRIGNAAAKPMNEPNVPV